MLYLFLEKDIKAIDEQIKEREQDIKKVNQDIADSCNQSSETWHDNFGFEEGVRQQRVAAKRLEDLLAIKAQASLVEIMDINRKTVDIGSIVELENINDNETQEYLIGSYLVVKKIHDNEISYNSPLGKALINRKPGEIFEFRNKKFKVLQVYAKK